MGVVRQVKARMGSAWRGLARPGAARHGKGKEHFQGSKAVNTNQTVTELNNVSNDAQETVELGIPYTASITIQGVAPLLFHRWSVDAVQEKADAKKGSKAKKEDNIESYVFRTEDGMLHLPAEYLRMSIVNAAKFRQDPRSPRKSAMDLFKAAIFPVFPLCSLGKGEWDFIDRRRAVVQRNGITRCRPAFNTGWRATAEFGVVLPEYVNPAMLNAVAQDAGRLVGVGDFRPTFGRFLVTRFEVKENDVEAAA
jgi:hypothetical protein